ncbi:MAG: hypothetical protein IT497_07480 [Ottowia sp.]|nr:hypothetical protein [Ottowia sp.]
MFNISNTIAQQQHAPLLAKHDHVEDASAVKIYAPTTEAIPQESAATRVFNWVKTHPTTVIISALALSGAAAGAAMMAQNQGTSTPSLLDPHRTTPHPRKHFDQHIIGRYINDTFVEGNVVGGQFIPSNVTGVDTEHGNKNWQAILNYVNQGQFDKEELNKNAQPVTRKGPHIEWEAIDGSGEGSEEVTVANEIDKKTAQKDLFKLLQGSTPTERTVSAEILAEGSGEETTPRQIDKRHINKHERHGLSAHQRSESLDLSPAHLASISSQFGKAHPGLSLPKNQTPQAALDYFRKNNISGFEVLNLLPSNTTRI